MSRFIEVAKQSQIPEGGTIGVEIEGKRIALAKLKGEVYALADTCPSRGPRVSYVVALGESGEKACQTAVIQVVKLLECPPIPVGNACDELDFTRNGCAAAVTGLRRAMCVVVASTFHGGILSGKWRSAA